MNPESHASSSDLQAPSFSKYIDPGAALFVAKSTVVSGKESPLSNWSRADFKLQDYSEQLLAQVPVF